MQTDPGIDRESFGANGGNLGRRGLGHCAQWRTRVWPKAVALAAMPLLGGLFLFFAMTSSALAQLVIEDDPPRQRDLTGVKMLTITGKVLDERGMPADKAQVVVVASEYGRSFRPIGVSQSRSVGDILPPTIEFFGPIATDAQGKFELKFPEAQTGVYAGLVVYAAARGHGCVAKDLGQTVGQSPLELMLTPEHVLRGRLIDLNGQPAAGVNVQATFRGSMASGHFRHRQASRRLLEIFDPVTTDDKGRFLIRGLGPEQPKLNFGVEIEGGNYAPLHSYIKAVPIDSEATETISLSPAKRIYGQVTYADNSKPAANVRIVIPTLPGGDGKWVETRSDANGEFSIVPYAAEERKDERYHRYRLHAFAPTGQQYLVADVFIPAFRGASQQVDVKLERGVLVRGQVTEATSGNPIPKARVQFIAKHGLLTTGFWNRDAFGNRDETSLQTAITGDDGTYELPAPSQGGHLLVLGPTVDYTLVETSRQEIEEWKPPGKARYFANAVARVELKPDEQEHHVDFTLRKGVRLKGRVVDPDNKPVDQFIIFSRSYLPSGYEFTLGGAGNWRDCRNGEFELPGCDPDQTHVVHVYDRKNGWGTMAELSRKHETEPALVKLEPCGSIEARFVDDDGKPVKEQAELKCMLVDGDSRYLYRGGKNYPLQAVLLHFDRLSDDSGPHLRMIHSDDDGRFSSQLLIPGAKYMMHWTTKGDGADFAWSEYVFSVNAGEKKNLGAINIKAGQAKE